MLLPHRFRPNGDLDIFAEEQDLHYKMILEILSMEGIHTLEVPVLLNPELYKDYELEITASLHSILRKQG